MAALNPTRWLLLVEEVKLHQDTHETSATTYKLMEPHCPVQWSSIWHEQKILGSSSLWSKMAVVLYLGAEALRLRGPGFQSYYNKYNFIRS